ncbi:hypothetical protein MMC19_005615 [Ptychographa xylographoides]|nr:hypothetical protein [Ptychographa xylographoides]
MPPISHPPMTSKQVKKAFKSASGPRFTDMELRKMERNAVLYDREQRIKEKEKTRIANKKKRLEKEEKAKEERKKAGVVEEGYVSPRQVRLGAYFGKDRKKEKEEEDEKDGISGKGTEEDNAAGPAESACAMSTSEERATIRKSETIAVLEPMDLALGDDDWASFFPSSTQVARELSRPAPVGIPGVVAPCTPKSSLSATMMPPPPKLSPGRNRLSSLQQPTPKCHEFMPETLPVFSTQDLELSADDLAELNTTVKPTRAPSVSAETPADPATFDVNDENEPPVPIPVAIVNKADVTPRHPQSSSPPFVEHAGIRNSTDDQPKQNSTPSHSSPPTQPPSTRPHIPKNPSTSTHRTFILADSSVMPGHPSTIPPPHRHPPPNRPSKRNFGTPCQAKTPRPPPTKGHPHPYPPTQGITATPKEAADVPQENGGTGSFDFGDAMLSTQELLDFVT